MLSEHILANLVKTLNKHLGNRDKAARYVRRARRYGFRIFRADINSSSYKYTLSNGGIRCGFGAIRHVGKAMSGAIVHERNTHGRYRNIFDFFKRVDLSGFDRHEVNSLIMVGALDSLHPERTGILEAYSSQSLFEDAPSLDYLGSAPGMSSYAKLLMERELIGFFVTGFDLEHYHNLMVKLGAVSTQELDKSADEVCLVGMLADILLLYSNERFQGASGVLEDAYGCVQLDIPPKEYRKYYLNLDLDASLGMVTVKGKVVHENPLQGRKLVVREMYTLQDASRLFS